MDLKQKALEFCQTPYHSRQKGFVMPEENKIAGWKRIWILVYRANDGKFYPSGNEIFGQRNVAERKMRERNRRIEGDRYRVMCYEASR